MPYMQYAAMQYYYNELKTGSLEVNVHSMWSNLLVSFYFRVERNYGFRAVYPRTPRADITIASVESLVNGDLVKKVIVVSKNKRKKPQLVARDAAWEVVVEQATAYLKAARAEQGNSDTLYVIGAVGIYSRFYIFRPGASEVEDYPGTNGKSFELARDEAEIEALLDDLVTKTS